METAKEWRTQSVGKQRVQEDGECWRMESAGEQRVTESGENINYRRIDPGRRKG